MTAVAGGTSSMSRSAGARRRAKRRRATLKQLAGQPLILREPGSGLRHCFEKSLTRAGLTLGDFHIVLELGSNEMIKSAVLRGNGIAILSLLAARKEIDAGQLVAVSVRGLQCDRDLYVAHDRRRALAGPAGGDVDRRRFRANLYIEGIEPWAEREWVGRTLRLGPVRCKVVDETIRCGATTVNPATCARDLNLPKILEKAYGHMFCGVYLQALDSGEIGAGAAVEIGEP